MKVAEVVILGTVQDGRIVLSRPVPLPDGTVVSVSMTPLQVDQPSEAQAEEDVEDFADESFAGMWADHPDMADGGAAWVHRVRHGWKQQTARQD